MIDTMMISSFQQDQMDTLFQKKDFGSDCLPDVAMDLPEDLMMDFQSGFDEDEQDFLLLAADLERDDMLLQEHHQDADVSLDGCDEMLAISNSLQVPSSLYVHQDARPVSPEPSVASSYHASIGSASSSVEQQQQEIQQRLEACMRRTDESRARIQEFLQNCTGQYPESEAYFCQNGQDWHRQKVYQWASTLCHDDNKSF